MQSTRLRWIWLLPAAAIALTVAIWPQVGHTQAGVPTQARYIFPPVGLIPGELLRVSVANPHDLAPPCRIYLYDAKNNTIGDTGIFKLPAVQFVSFDFDRNKLAESGETNTGRLEVRAVVVASFPNGSPPDPCRPGVEMISSDNGHTFATMPPPDPDLF